MANNTPVFFDHDGTEYSEDEYVHNPDAFVEARHDAHIDTLLKAGALDKRAKNQANKIVAAGFAPALKRSEVRGLAAVAKARAMGRKAPVATSDDSDSDSDSNSMPLSS